MVIIHDIDYFITDIIDAATDSYHTSKRSVMDLAIFSEIFTMKLLLLLQRLVDQVERVVSDTKKINTEQLLSSTGVVLPKSTRVDG